MPHFYLDDEFTKFLFSISTCLTFFQKVSEFVKLFNAITLMHYMTKKKKALHVLCYKRCFVFNFSKNRVTRRITFVVKDVKFTTLFLDSY